MAGKLRVLVCGGRRFGRDSVQEYDFILDELDRLAQDWPKTADHMFKPRPDVVVITGGSNGVDTIADEWAVLNYCETVVYPADWRTYGRAAGPRRNQQMLDEGRPDLVVAFPGGTGTADMVERAERAGVPVVRLSYPTA